MNKKLIFKLLLLILILPLDVASAQNKSKSQCERSWPVYFKQFQAAVKSGDKARIKKLCDFSSLGEPTFDEIFSYFFEGESKDKILKAKHNDAEYTDQNFKGLENAKNNMQLNFVEIGSDEEGNVYESATIYYFAKVKKKYKLVYLMAAG